jgi:hypothetical protein
LLDPNGEDFDKLPIMDMDYIVTQVDKPEKLTMNDYFNDIEKFEAYINGAGYSDICNIDTQTKYNKIQELNYIDNISDSNEGDWKIYEFHESFNNLMAKYKINLNDILLENNM